MSDDIFLKGRLTIRQPLEGFRSGTDAVLLAAAAASLPFKSALEAGCGVGAALLSVAALTNRAEIELVGLEKDQTALSLALHNLAANHLTGQIRACEGDALAPPAELIGHFDLVFSNPPFFDDDKSIRDPAPERQAAYILGAPLEAWIKSMLAMATAKGRFLMVHRADRLPDIIAALKGRAGDIGICPIRSRADEPAKRVLVSARKGSRAPMRLLAGMEMHPAVGQGRFSDAYQAICDGGLLAV